MIAATHRDLAEEARGGRFRADLYYRLHVLTLRAPALREHREDIPILAACILRRIGRRDGVWIHGIRADALAALVEHSWPGNVRELEGALERAVHALDDGGVVDVSALGEGFASAPNEVRDAAPDLRGRTRAYEAQVIAGAIAAHGGNKTRAAHSLGLSRQGLWKKLRRLGGDSGRGAAREGARSAPAEPDSP